MCSRPVDLGPEPGPQRGDEDGALDAVQHGRARVDLEDLVRGRVPRPRPRRRRRSGRRARCAHSHDNTSSTTSCTLRPVVSSRCASSASRSGDASRVESIRSRRATPSGASSCAPPGPLLGRRRQVDLQLGPGEDDRPDVPALDHSPAVRVGPGPLALDQLPPHVGVGGDDRDGPAHLGRADDVGHVAAVDGDPLAPPRWSPPSASAATAARSVGRYAVVQGQRRPRRGTWRRCRAGRRPGARPPPSRRSTCRRRPGRRWPPAAAAAPGRRRRGAAGPRRRPGSWSRPRRTR